MAYKSPVRDFTFILNEVLEIDRYTNQPGFQDVSSDLIGQILEEGAKFADEVIAPMNNPGDKEGCTCRRSPSWAGISASALPTRWRGCPHRRPPSGPDTSRRRPMRPPSSGQRPRRPISRLFVTSPSS